MDIILFSMDSDVDYTENFAAYLSFLPSGSSLKTFLHYAQLIDDDQGRFKRFDYESKENNIEKYGQDQAPTYDLSGFTFSTSLFYGDELDLFSANNL